MALENRTRSGYRNESESESESVREGLDWVPLYRICSIYCGGGGRGKTLFSLRHRGVIYPEPEKFRTLHVIPEQCLNHVNPALSMYSQNNQ